MSSTCDKWIWLELGLANLLEVKIKINDTAVLQGY